MARRDEAGGRAAATYIGRVAIVALIVVALIAGWIFFFADGDRAGSEMPVDARPTGAGSLPDGAVDERIEGLGNETSTGDFIDQSAASDSRPAILDPAEGPEPAPGVDELDVPARINDGVAEPEAPGEDVQNP